jgi:hypothetical protein
MKKSANKAMRYLLPSIGDVLWIAAFLGVIGLGPRMMNIDGDLGRHLTIGQYILDNGQVPLYDLFSHSMLGQPVTPHEWLAQVIFALAYRMLGLDGVVLVCGVVIATAFWLVFRRARMKSKSLLPAVLLVILAIAAASLHWLTRPHVFTFLMLALWLNELEHLRAGRLSRWWMLPLLMLFWANLHGAFIAGFVTWALYGLGLGWDVLFHRLPKGSGLHGNFWRAYLLGGGAALAVTVINPSGIGLWGTSVGFIGNAYLVGHTAEYLPPNFHHPSTWPFLLMIGLLAVLFGLQNKRPETAHVITSAAWLVMALYSVRNVPLFAIVAAPILASALNDLIASNQHLFRPLARFYDVDARLMRTDASLNGLLWPLIILIFVPLGFLSGARLDLQQSGNAFDAHVFPVHAVDWLEENPRSGNGFNYFPWGGYMLHRLWPEQQVFIDGQTDFYGEALTRQYEQVLTLSPGWEGVLEQYNVDWVIMPPGERLPQELRGRQNWQLIYEDETAVIFIFKDVD